MEAIISQVIELAGAQNELGRKKIIDQLRDLSYTLESPDDVLHRVMYRVSNFENSSPLYNTNFSAPGNCSSSHWL